MGKTVEEMAKEYIEALAYAVKYDKLKVEANKKATALSALLYEKMEEEGVNEMKVNGVKLKPTLEQNFQLKEELTLTNRWDDFEGWFDWLEKEGLGGVIKTKKTVHHGTRGKVLKEYQEEKGILPVFVKENFFGTIDTRGSKKDIEALAEEL